MKFGLQMWLEIRVDTGCEQLHFRFAPSEAESAKRAPRERDSSALFPETPGGSYPKGAEAPQSRKEIPMSPGKLSQDENTEMWTPTRSLSQFPVQSLPGGSQRNPPTTEARTPVYGRSLQTRRTENIPIMSSMFWVLFILEEQTGRCSKKKQRIT